jgi:hypothetical protein
MSNGRKPANFKAALAKGFGADFGKARNGYLLGRLTRLRKGYRMLASSHPEAAALGENVVVIIDRVRVLVRREKNSELAVTLALLWWFDEFVGKCWEARFGPPSVRDLRERGALRRRLIADQNWRAAAIELDRELAAQNPTWLARSKIDRAIELKRKLKLTDRNIEERIRRVLQDRKKGPPPT